METERLVLEPMLRGDAAEMFPLLSDFGLYEFTGGEAPSSAESLRGVRVASATRLVRWLRSAGVHEVRACVSPAHAASGAVALRAGLHRTADMEDGEEVWTSRLP